MFIETFITGSRYCYEIRDIYNNWSIPLFENSFVLVLQRVNYMGGLWIFMHLFMIIPLDNSFLFSFARIT